MERRHFLASVIAIVAATPSMAAAAGTDYPTRPIRMVVPFPPGSTTDAMARFLGEQVSRTIGQSVVIDNKAGAQGSIAAAEVARAVPDGHTLLVGTNSTQAANVYLIKSLPYDPRKDFAAITQFAVNPLVMVIRADLPAMTLAEFMTYARARPGQLNYGIGNTGSLVTAQKLTRMANLQAEGINYPGSPQAIADLLAGRLDFMITDVSVTRPHIESGKLKALGVTTQQRLASLPNVPTISEAGLSGYEFTAWGGLFAPAATPPAVIATLNKAFVEALSSPEAQRFFERQGQVAAPMTSSRFSAYVNEEIATWGRLIEASGRKAE